MPDSSRPCALIFGIIKFIFRTGVGVTAQGCDDSDIGATFEREVACCGVWSQDKNCATIRFSSGL